MPTVGVAEGVIFLFVTSYKDQGHGCHVEATTYVFFLQHSSTSFQLFTCGGYVRVSAETATLIRVRCFLQK